MTYADELARVRSQHDAGGTRRRAARLLRQAGRNATEELLLAIALAPHQKGDGSVRPLTDAEDADARDLVRQAIALQSDPAIVGRRLDPATTPVTPLEPKRPKVRESVPYSPPSRRAKPESQSTNTNHTEGGMAGTRLSHEDGRKLREFLSQMRAADPDLLPAAALERVNKKLAHPMTMIAFKGHWNKCKPNGKRGRPRKRAVAVTEIPAGKEVTGQPNSIPARAVDADSFRGAAVSEQPGTSRVRILYFDGPVDVGIGVLEGVLRGVRAP
ncbi:MAG: hypothetical protein ACRENP_17525 [Longimicrobiales bacterium]